MSLGDSLRAQHFFSLGFRERQRGCAARVILVKSIIASARRSGPENYTARDSPVSLVSGLNKSSAWSFHSRSKHQQHTACSTVGQPIHSHPPRCPGDPRSSSKILNAKPCTPWYILATFSITTKDDISGNVIWMKESDLKA